MIVARATVSLPGYPVGWIGSVDETDPRIAYWLDASWLVPSDGSAPPPYTPPTLGELAGDVAGPAEANEIQPGVVGTTELADEAVGTDQLDDDAVTLAKLDLSPGTNGQVLGLAGGVPTMIDQTGGGVDMATQAELDAHKTSADHDGRYFTEAEVTALLAAKAPLASPALTGNPTAPTPSSSDDDTTLATTAFVQDLIAGVEVGGGIPGVYLLKRDGGAFGDAVLLPDSGSMVGGTNRLDVTGTVWVFSSGDIGVIHCAVARAGFDDSSGHRYEIPLEGVVKTVIDSNSVTLGDPDQSSWGVPGDVSTAPDLDAAITVDDVNVIVGHNDTDAVNAWRALIPGDPDGSQNDLSGGILAAEAGNYLTIGPLDSIKAHGVRLIGLGSAGANLASGSAGLQLGGACFLSMSTPEMICFGDDAEPASTSDHVAPVIESITCIDASDAYQCDALVARGITNGEIHNFAAYECRAGIVMASFSKDSAWWDIHNTRLRYNAVGLDLQQCSVNFGTNDTQVDHGMIGILHSLGSYMKVIGPKQDHHGIPTWQASATQALNKIILPPTPNGHRYKVVASGTSNATVPTWPTLPGGEVTVNSVTYKEFGLLPAGREAKGARGLWFRSPNEAGQSGTAGGSSVIAFLCVENHSDDINPTYPNAMIELTSAPNGITIMGCQMRGLAGSPGGIGYLFVPASSNQPVTGVDVTGGNIASADKAVVLGQYATNNTFTSIQTAGSATADVHFQSGSAYNLFINPFWSGTVAARKITDDNSPSTNLIQNEQFTDGRRIFPYAGSGTPTGGANGDIRIGDGKIWVKDPATSTWKSAAIT